MSDATLLLHLQQENDRMRRELAEVEAGGGMLIRHYDIGDPPIQSRDALSREIRKSIAGFEHLIARLKNEAAGGD